MSYSVKLITLGDIKTFESRIQEGEREQDGVLTLYSYDRETTQNDPTEYTAIRGVIFDGNTNVMQSFGLPKKFFTSTPKESNVQFNTNYPFDPTFTFVRAYEGSILRVYHQQDQCLQQSLVIW